MSQKCKLEKDKGGIKMAILTADCKEVFAVSSDKVEEFKNQKRNEEVFKKINASVEKLSKHLKMELEDK